MLELVAIFILYLSWWYDSERTSPGTPFFQRRLFYQLLNVLKTVPQILSITAPWHFEKDTLVT